MAYNPVFDGLLAYVEQKRLPLLANAVIKSGSKNLFNLQTGVKTSAALNLLDTDVEFGDGSSCGWDEAGEQTLSQRVISTGQIKINMEYCDKDMLKYWTQYQVRVAAGQKTLPFEEDFINGVVKDVQAKLETAIFQGDTDDSDPNLNKFDGLIKILGDESDVITFTTGASVKASVDAAYMAIPEAVLDGASILIGADDFREYVQALVAANLYHYNPEAPVDSVVIPGTNVVVRKANGLNGTHKLIAGQLDKNFFYGCDMIDDAEIFDFWYSKDDRVFKLAIEFNAGVQVAFPAEVVMGDTK